MLDMTTTWWEIILRVSVIYLALLAMIRLSGKRQVGQLTPMDLLVILLVSETVSPALTDDDGALPSALLAAGTLFGLAVVIAVATHRLRWLERFVEGAPAVIIRDGRVMHRVMRSEHITDEDIDHALRQHGVMSLDDVSLGVVEESGEITIIKQDTQPGRATLQ